MLRELYELLERLQTVTTRLEEATEAMSDVQGQIDQRAAQLEKVVADTKQALTDVSIQINTVQHAVAALKQELANAGNPIAAASFTQLDQAISAAQTMLVQAQDVDTASTADAATDTQPVQHAVAAVDPATGKPLYTFAGPAGSPIDTAVWPEAQDVTGPNSEKLYTFAQDTAGQPPTGPTGTNPEWALFTATPTPATHTS